MERWGALLGSCLFRTNPTSQVSREDDTNRKYFSDKRVDRCVYVLIVILGLLMLIGPLWWLSFELDSSRRLGIITGFIVLFTLLMGGATNARPFEAMAATAG